MPSWTISAIFTNVSSAWERSFSSYRNVQTIEASVLLNEIDQILRKTDTLLENHKTFFSPTEYENFKAQHTAFQWVLTDQERQYGDVKDPKLQHHRTPTQQLAEKEACESRAIDLLENVKTYRSTLLEASRHARLETSPAFPDLEPIQTEPQTVAQAEQEALSAPQITPPVVNLPVLPPAVSNFTSRPPSPRGPRISVLPTSMSFASARSAYGWLNSVQT
ncbi:hypothetical protein FRC06_005776 [Ceratobasidium sp. 370]|nr:hypothetical protein FRC06_005776 [Ceratobasidium sp. 370]